MLIHPFDHADIVAGQATVGLEILKQIPMSQPSWCRPAVEVWSPESPPSCTFGAAGPGDRSAGRERGGLAGFVGRRTARARGVDVDDG